MTVTQDKQVWELAAAVIGQHGGGALDEAERRAKEALDADDMIGHGIWLAVKATIAELARTPGAGDPMN
jgi:hypothetical protein